MAFEGGKPRSDKANSPNQDALAWIQGWLGGRLGDDIAELIRQRSRIVQEHVGREVLSRTELVEWFDY